MKFHDLHLHRLSTFMHFVFFLQHFLREEAVIGTEYNAQLLKTLLARKYTSALPSVRALVLNS